MGKETRDLRGSATGERGVAVEAWVERRRLYLDNLKVLLIAGIIVIHAVLGYASTVEVWTYTEFREVTLAPATEIVLFVLVSPFGFFLIALLFLVAGLLTPGSRERKGTRRFLRDRLLRLGMPFAVYALLVQPTLDYALQHPFGDAPGSFWAEYYPREEGQLDAGPLWFVGTLLVFSLGYAGWHAGRRQRPSTRLQVHPVSLRTLVVTACVVAPASFVVRLVYPYGGESGITDLNLWEWPACIAVFCVGIGAARDGWLAEIPDELARQCRTATLLAVVAMATLLMTVGLLDAVDDAMGGWHWAAAAFATIEAVLTVFGSVWLLRVAQRRLAARHRWGPVLSRSAYGAFMVQAPFLLGLAMALRPLGLPAEAKALVVAGGSVAGSFALAWLLIRRVPGVGRVL